MSEKEKNKLKGKKGWIVRWKRNKKGGKKGKKGKGGIMCHKLIS